MALPREEQAKIIRVLASMISAGHSFKEALLSLAEDYRNYGLIEVPPSLYPLVPESQRVGWVAEELESMVSEIESGRKPEEVIAEARIFDEDVRASLASAVASGNLQKMAGKLADLLELEVQLLGKLKKVLIAPTLAMIIALIFTYLMIFRFTPKMVSMATHKERLPATVKLAYAVSQHPFLFVLAVLVVIGGVVWFLRSGLWKPFLPAYREFEKLRFFNWLKILLESGWSEVRALQFLLDAGFSKKWVEAVEDALYNLEAGERLDRALEVLVERGLLSHSDFSFIRSGVKSGNVPKQIEPLLRFLSLITDKEIEKSTTFIQAAILLVVGGYVAALYLGLLLPLTTSLQKAM
jgi:type II secretory pathway component PulF